MPVAGRGFSYQTVEMKGNPAGNVYSAAIPAFRAGDTVYYYLQARDATTAFPRIGQRAPRTYPSRRVAATSRDSTLPRDLGIRGKKPPDRGVS